MMNALVEGDSWAETTGQLCLTIIPFRPKSFPWWLQTSRFQLEARPNACGFPIYWMKTPGTRLLRGRTCKGNHYQHLKPESENSQLLEHEVMGSEVHTRSCAKNGSCLKQKFLLQDQKGGFSGTFMQVNESIKVSFQIPELQAPGRL